MADHERERKTKPIILPSEKKSLPIGRAIKGTALILTLATVAYGCHELKQSTRASSDRRVLRRLVNNGLREATPLKPPAKERTQTVGQILRVSDGGNRVSIACSEKPDDYLVFGHRVDQTSTTTPTTTTLLNRPASTRRPTTSTSSPVATVPGNLMHEDILYVRARSDYHDSPKPVEMSEAVQYPVNNASQVSTFLREILPTLCVATKHS